MANFPWEPVDQGRPASDGGPASQSDDAKVLSLRLDGSKPRRRRESTANQHPNQIGSAP
jgi:hypothetical protein